MIERAMSVLCGTRRPDSDVSSMRSVRIISDKDVVLKRMLAPSPAKSPSTVMEEHTQTIPTPKPCVFHCRALARVYLELCKTNVLNCSINDHTLRIVGPYYFDPFGVVALTCAFVNLVFSRCSEEQRESYFDNTAGKCCLTSVFTLAAKFCSSESMNAVFDEHGMRRSIATFVYELLFGQFETMYGRRKAVDMLWQTEAYLLQRLGGRLFDLSQTSITSVADGLLADAIENTRDLFERSVLLKCRNLIAVYATSMYMIDQDSEPAIASVVKGASSNVLLAAVAAICSTASLVAGGIDIPKSVQHLNASTDPLTLTFAMRTLNYFRTKTEFVPLVAAARRDIISGDLFSEVTQTKAVELLVVRAQALARGADLEGKT